jgi:hypothetical protein
LDQERGQGNQVKALCGSTGTATVGTIRENRYNIPLPVGAVTAGLTASFPGDVDKFTQLSDITTSQNAVQRGISRLKKWFQCLTEPSRHTVLPYPSNTRAIFTKL